MNAKQYRDNLAILGLSQGAFARALDIHPRTSGRYAQGELPVPTPIAMLMALLVEARAIYDPNYARGMAGLPPVTLHPPNAPAPAATRPRTARSRSQA